MESDIKVQIWPGVTLQDKDIYMALDYHFKLHPVNQRPVNVVIASLVILPEMDIVVVEPADGGGKVAHVLSITEAEGVPALWAAILNSLHTPAGEVVQ
jgi:hypothetical protein